MTIYTPYVHRVSLVLKYVSTIPLCRLNFFIAIKSFHSSRFLRSRGPHFVSDGENDVFKACKSEIFTKFKNYAFISFTTLGLTSKHELCFCCLVLSISWVIQIKICEIPMTRATKPIAIKNWINKIKSMTRIMYHKWGIEMWTMVLAFFRITIVFLFLMQFKFDLYIKFSK